MTGPIDMLAAPIRALLTSVGSGEVPGVDPAQELRRCGCALAVTSRGLDAATTTALPQWQSHAADAAASTIGAHGRHGTALSEDSTATADLIEQARVVVAEAARQLRVILDSFVTAADALGPSVYTPSGVAAVIPIAIAHLQRALVVVNRARDRLAALTRRATAIGRHRAPGSVNDLAALRTRLTSMLQGSAPSAPPAARSNKPGSAPAATSTRSASATGSGTQSPAATTGEPPTPGAVPITLPDGSVAWAPDARAATAVRAALGQRGVPYAWGGTTPGRGLDCSALTQYAYRQAGVELPRLAQDQDTAGFRVDRAELLPGDLAVWSGHVAMIVGNNQMIEAGDPVQVSPIRTSNLDQVFEGFYRPR